MITNMNVKTGIHYGVIPKNDLYNCAEEFFLNADDLTYREAINNIKEQIKEAVENILDTSSDDDIESLDYTSLFDSIETIFQDHYEGEYASMRYEQNGYILESSNDDSDLFVIESPYYTMAPECSPCAPNAGYLRDAQNDKEQRLGGPLTTYCLGKEWFDNEKAPYSYWKVV